MIHEDGTASTTWSIDLHYPDPKNTAHFPGQEFKSIAEHIQIYPYPVPYRFLYSRNVDNLFMAGRNISVTHVALGTIRVMRTTGMLGEVVGMAASLCREHQVQPRAIYQNYLGELKALMEQGTGNPDLPNNQLYNLGGTLKERPVVQWKDWFECGCGADLESVSHYILTCLNYILIPINNKTTKYSHSPSTKLYFTLLLNK